jgi:hypothetical protein
MFQHKHYQQLKGSILLPTVIFIILLSVAAGGILSLSVSSYKLSKRNEIRARARSLAESEMEIFYYKFKEFLIKGEATTASQIPGLFSALGTDYVCDVSSIPTTAGIPYVGIYRDSEALDSNNLEKDDWIVRRSITVSSINPSAAGTSNEYVIQGNIPNTTKTGKFSYLVARVSVEPGRSNPLYGQVKVKIGRRMSYATSSSFQYNVFAQGDLEFAPGGNTIIEGDIAANGSIYMGASSGGQLTVNGYISYLSGNYFNTTSDGVTATYRKPGTLAPNGSVVTADASTLSAPIFGTGQEQQVQTMNTPENLLGGLDASDIATRNPQLFGALDSTGAPTTDALNSVYRSLIAPPPSALAAALATATDTHSSEYPSTTTLSTASDDDSVSALRAYNRAGLIVTVNASGAVVSVTGKDGADYSATVGTAISTSTLWDQRENKSVAITQVDVGALKTKLEASYSGFNGLLYVLLANSSNTSPAAVRLVNGATTPGINTTTQTASGFSVATNGGLYIQGDYNTTTTTGASAITSTYTGKINPTMLMADSVTVLSSSWDDTNSTENGSISGSTSKIDNRVATAGQTTINSAILTGNTAAKVSDSASSASASGGGQNLIRFMEDWKKNGSEIVFRGSLGRLFDSRHFTSSYQQPGNVYQVPALRTFSFNSGLKTDDVPGQPLLTYFSRGDFFFWQ